MRIASVIVAVLAATTPAPHGMASPRNIKICTAAVATCDCLRQPRICVPVCQIEPPIGSHTF
jgi:hypothetical protein